MDDFSSRLAELGAELRRRRTYAGLTQDALAAAAGYPAARAAISRCEHAKEPLSDKFTQLVDEALDAGGVLINLCRQVQAARLRQAANRVSPPSEDSAGRSSTTAPDRLDRIGDLRALSEESFPPAEEDTADRRQLPQASGGRAALDETDTVLAELLPSGDPLAPLEARAGGKIGTETVVALAARVHGLRLADDVLAGGDLIRPAFRELGSAVRLYRESRHAEDVGQALLVQVGELAQIAGWIASDAGRHEQAERAYAVGISATRQTGDGPLVAHLMSSLAYQFANTGREREGVDLAEAAIKNAGRDAPGKTRALFLDRLAWALTQAGQQQPAMRALGNAHDALNDDEDDAPRWAYWVSREELDVMDARVYTEMRRPLRAVPLLTSALDRYDSTHTREIALYRSWLAMALADANEPEQAAAEGRRVITLCTGMTSDRVINRSRAVLRRLHDFRNVPDVGELLDDYDHLVSGNNAAAVTDRQTQTPA